MSTHPVNNEEYAERRGFFLSGTDRIDWTDPTGFEFVHCKVTQMSPEKNILHYAIFHYYLISQVHQ